MKTLLTFGFLSIISLFSLLGLNGGMVLDQPPTIIEDPSPEVKSAESIIIKDEIVENFTSSQNDIALIEDDEDSENTAEVVEVSPTDDSFVKLQEKVTTGEAGVITGVYVNEILSLPVIQQPNGQPAYVSPIKGVVTQFGLVESYGAIGLMAHNFLSGEQFFNLEIGQIVTVIFGNGSTLKFEINEIQQYQALTPNSVNSAFRNLDHPEIQVSAKKLFNDIYSNFGDLVFQTCIERENNLTWGRLFIVAKPLS